MTQFQIQANKATELDFIFLPLNEANTDVSYELSEMGFDGSYLCDLLKVIVDDESLQEFYNFIILKGENMTKLLLVHRFMIHMKDKRSFQTFEHFEEAYISANTVLEKHNVIEKLLASKTSTAQLNKILLLIETKKLSLNLIYDRFVKYRKMYSVDEIITLIENIPIA